MCRLCLCGEIRVSAPVCNWGGRRLLKTASMVAVTAALPVEVRAERV